MSALSSVNCVIDFNTVCTIAGNAYLALLSSIVAEESRSRVWRKGCCLDFAGTTSIFFEGFLARPCASSPSLALDHVYCLRSGPAFLVRREGAHDQV